MRFRTRAIALAAALAAAAATNVRAEVNEITIAQQYGVSFLPLMAATTPEPHRRLKLLATRN